MKHENETAQPAPLGQVERGVMPLAPERTTFADWLRACKGRLDDCGDVNYHWTDHITMGEHDAALMAWRFQQARIDALRAAVAALLKCPSGEYCDAYPAALKLAQDAMRYTE